MSQNGHDFRVHSGFPDHPKTERLSRVAGETAVRCLLRLWAWTAANRFKGVLYGMDILDIAVVSRWDGDPQSWVDALVSTGWMDECDPHAPRIKSAMRGLPKPDCTTYALHDWEEHQPYIFNSDARIDSAKKAASARWDKRYGKKRGASEPHSGSHTKRNAPAPPPSPSPKGGRGAGSAAGPNGAAATPAGEERRWRKMRIVRDSQGTVHVEYHPGTWCPVYQFDSSLTSKDVWEDAQ